MLWQRHKSLQVTSSRFTRTPQWLAKLNDRIPQWHRCLVAGRTGPPSARLGTMIRFTRIFGDFFRGPCHRKLSHTPFFSIICLENVDLYEPLWVCQRPKAPAAPAPKPAAKKARAAWACYGDTTGANQQKNVDVSRCIMMYHDVICRYDEICLFSKIGGRSSSANAYCDRCTKVSASSKARIARFWILPISQHILCVWWVPHFWQVSIYNPSFKDPICWWINLSFFLLKSHIFFDMHLPLSCDGCFWDWTFPEIQFANSSPSSPHVGDFPL